MITNAFAQATLAFDVVLALWLGMATVLASTARRQDSYGFALIGFTVPIVTLSEVSQPLSVFQTAMGRCSSLLLGIGCAYASAALVAAGVGTARAGLVSLLLATRDDPARDALNFLKGAALANLIGTVAHDAVLTSTGDFLLLAAVVLPTAGEMAQAALNLERTDIRSPVNGWVTNLLLQSGGFATTGDDRDDAGQCGQLLDRGLF